MRRGSYSEPVGQTRTRCTTRLMARLLTTTKRSCNLHTANLTAGALDRLSEHAKYITDREVFEVLYFLVE